MEDAVQITGKNGSYCKIPKGVIISGHFKLWLEIVPDESSKESNWMDLTGIVNRFNDTVKIGIGD